ncbi:hypothetical protein J4E86_006096 [Alternaria arbusti]|uniref:uncharacterized protein n=1 Tax=Alternaria arbusti TaxID=232088 RepID=UPI0022211F2D|nr:uncharacterized protein J4E86_006096 [Alternaria arbusti]KAI4954786.1 hypothetical protein J4E86_006096 [Alternaria arbusti]
MGLFNFFKSNTPPPLYHHGERGSGNEYLSPMPSEQDPSIHVGNDPKTIKKRVKERVDAEIWIERRKAQMEKSERSEKRWRERLSSKRVAGLAMNHTVQGIFALETTGLLAWLMILVLWDLCPWVVVAEEDVTQDGRTYRVWAVETQMFQIIVLGDWTTVEGEEEDPTLDFRTLGMWAMEARLFQIIALVDGTMVEGEEEEVKRMGVARVGLVEVLMTPICFPDHFQLDEV